MFISIQQVNCNNFIILVRYRLSVFYFIDSDNQEPINKLEGFSYIYIWAPGIIAIDIIMYLVL